MTPIDLIGFAAGTLTTVAFVPQVLKTWQTRSARDVSTGLFVLFSAGVALWLLFGVLSGSWPVILANGLTLVLALLVLWLKWRFHRNGRRNGEALPVDD